MLTASQPFEWICCIVNKWVRFVMEMSNKESQTRRNGAIWLSFEWKHRFWSLDHKPGNLGKQTRVQNGHVIWFHLFSGTSKANPYKNIAFLCALLEKQVNFEGPRAEWSVVSQPTGLHHGAPIRLVNPSIDTCFSCFLKHVNQLWKILNMQHHSLQHFNCAFFNLVFNFREFNISYIHFVGSISTQPTVLCKEPLLKLLVFLA